jgi:serine/threonine-protein kinase
MEIPASLEEVVLRCLEKRPEDRPTDARELERLLAATGLEGAWTETDAEQWWGRHLPRPLLSDEGTAAPSGSPRTINLDRV